MNFNQHGKSRLPQVALGTMCLLTFSGCGAIDLLSWRESKASESISLEKKYVFNLPSEESKLASSKAQQAKVRFPYQAPGIKLPSPRLEVNHEVRRELSNYLRNNATCISSGLERQEGLFPVLAKILEDEGLPEELLNLALIESGFKADAASPAGAVGLWQFMNSTARLYGLEVSKRVDERKDPILSTMAAARHLKELYSKYNDWYLVLAAYNAGDGAVDRALSGAKRNDYWSLVRTGKINPETSRFVPKFIAAAILQKLYNRYGNKVQLAQYIDRHLVAVSDSGSNKRYAFSLDSDSSIG